MQPLVSVIVPLYNAAPYIDEALESIKTVADLLALVEEYL